MTIGLDFQTIDAAVWGRLVTDSAGATARAYLGTSSAMTAISGLAFAAFDVSLLERVKGAQVPTIWAGFERGSTSGRGRTDMRQIPYDWWLWGASKRDLEALASLMDALYSNQTLSTGRITVDLITAPTQDTPQALFGMRVRLAYSIYR